MKSSCWLLLSDCENNIQENEQIRIKEPLAADQALTLVCMLKAGLKD